MGIWASDSGAAGVEEKKGEGQDDQAQPTNQPKKKKKINGLSHLLCWWFVLQYVYPREAAHLCQCLLVSCLG